jgi:hypothetical protein
MAATLFSIWLLSLKIFLQSIAFESASLAAHNFVLSFDHKHFVTETELKKIAKKKIDQFPFLTQLSRGFTEVRIEFNYFDTIRNQSFSQNELITKSVDPARISAVGARIYLCINKLGGTFSFFRLGSKSNSSSERDCLGQFTGNGPAHTQSESVLNTQNEELPLRILYTVATQTVLQSSRILRNGLENVDMLEERHALYKNFFSQNSKGKGH